MSTVQFSHRRNNTVSKDFTLEINPRGGVTSALEIPQSWLLAGLELGESFDKKTGIAICSTEDNYNKKTGRELASSRMKATKLTCIEIHEDDDGSHKIALADGKGNVFLLKRLASGGVHFLSMVKGLSNEQSTRETMLYFNRTSSWNG